MRISIAVVAVVALLGGSFVHAEESLAEAAAREKEKRKDKPAPKVMTQDDLARAGGRSLSVTGEGDPAAETPTTEDGASAEAKGGDAKAPSSAPAKEEKDKDPSAERADGEKAWHDRLDKANAEIARLQAEIQHMESDQNLYTNGANVSRLDDLRQKLAAAQESLDTLETERRHAGYRN